MIEPRLMQHPKLGAVFVRNNWDEGIADEVCIEYEPGFAMVNSLSPLLFDIGAHCGYASRFWLAKHPHGKVVSIEPWFPNFDVLSANLFQSVAHPLLGAIGGEDKWIHFKQPDWRTGFWGEINTGGQSFREGADIQGVMEAQPEYPEEITKEIRWVENQVRQHTLNSLIESFGVPDCVKFDCEGAEHQALLASIKDGSFNDIPLIIGEWHGMNVGHWLEQEVAPHRKTKVTWKTQNLGNFIIKK